MDTISDLGNALPRRRRRSRRKSRKSPTFDVDESIASAVLSRVTDVRTRLALSQVSKTWNAASSRAASLPPRLDFASCKIPRWAADCNFPGYVEEKDVCGDMIAYIMCMDGIFDIPESRVKGLLRDAWKDSAEGGDRILDFRNLRDEWEWEDHFRRFATEQGQTAWNLDTINTQLFTLINEGAVYRNNPEKVMVGIAMKGTERGYLPAICAVAGLFEAGQGGIKKDPTKAAELWDRARAKAETDVPSQYVLGRCMQMSPLRMREGTEWLKKAVAQGYPQAQCLLGQVYSLGSHGNAADLPAAFDLLEKAADQGHAGAAFYLGTIFLKRGDQVNAHDWFERASDPSMELGHPFAFMESRAQKIIDGIDYDGLSCEYLVDKYLKNLSEPSDQDTLSLEDLLIMAILEEEESSKKGKKKKKKKKKARA
jgi:TPR repeat protein